MIHFGLADVLYSSPSSEPSYSCRRHKPSYSCLEVSVLHFVLVVFVYCLFVLAKILRFQ